MRNFLGFLFLVVSFFNHPVFAQNEQWCAHMNNPEFRDQYEICVKGGIEPYKKPQPFMVRVADKYVCDGLKITSDVYNSFEFGKQLGLVKEENFNEDLYRKASISVEKFMGEKCNRMGAPELIDEALRVCTVTCDEQSVVVAKNKSDKKRIDEVARDCRSICKIDHLSKKRILDGITLQKKNSSDPACIQNSNIASPGLEGGPKNIMNFQNGNNMPPPPFPVKDKEPLNTAP